MTGPDRRGRMQSFAIKGPEKFWVHHTVNGERVPIHHWDTERRQCLGANHHEGPHVFAVEGEGQYCAVDPSRT